MSDIKIDLNLNQNLWAVLISLVGIGFAEYYKLSVLFVFSCILGVMTFLSFCFTLYFYTFHYCKNKKSKNRLMFK